MSKLSLSKKILLSINGISLILLIFTSFVIIGKFDHELNRELKEKLFQDSLLISSAVTNPLWNLEYAPVKETIKEVMKDPTYVGVEFLDAKSTSLLKMMEDGIKADAKQNIFEYKINHEGELLAIMKLSYTTAVIDGKIRSSAYTIGLVLILLQILISISTWLVLNRIMNQQIGIVTTLKSATNHLNEISTNLADSSRKSTEISSSISSSISEMSSALEELSGLTNKNYELTKDTAESSLKIKNSTEHGKSSINELNTSMSEINEATNNLVTLSTIIQQIADKTKIIDEIVFQTKLLSFNASVEAERAGEHGRGFAVVAQEVGSLAQLSGKSAVEISNIVKKSLSSVGEILSVTRAKVTRGTELVAKTTEIFDIISHQTSEVTTKNEIVLKASTEQKKGIESIAEVISNLDTIAHENDTLTHGTVEASHEVSEEANEVGFQVDTLNALIFGER